MYKYLLVFFLIIEAIVYSQASNRAMEYNFIYNKTNTFSFNEEEDEFSIMIERRKLPLVNRLVRFTSLNPSVFTFEVKNPSNNIDSEYEVVNTNVYIIPTDDNGVATAKLHFNSSGSGVLLIHILYVGSTGNTNISYEEFAYVNINDNSFKSKFLNVDDDIVNATSSFIVSVTILPILFLISIALIFISYFRHIYMEYKHNFSKIVIYSFFGFSSVRKNFLILILFTTIELILMAIIIISPNYLYSVVLLVLFIIGFTVRREKMYSIGFFIIACIYMMYLHLEMVFQNNSIDFIIDNIFLSHPILLLLLFFILASLFSGVYAPLSILVIYKVVFSVDNIGFVCALFGILLSTLFYVVKVKKNIPFFFELDFLRIKNIN